MSNMSYCRFHNTRLDLEDCVDTVERLMQSEEDALSREELRSAIDLGQLALKLVQMVADRCQVQLEDLQDSDIRAFFTDLNEDAVKTAHERRSDEDEDEDEDN